MSDADAVFFDETMRRMEAGMEAPTLTTSQEYQVLELRISKLCGDIELLRTELISHRKESAHALTETQRLLREQTAALDLNSREQAALKRRIDKLLDGLFDAVTGPFKNRESGV